ncbi:hypothetical protein Cfor_06832, partial [Coptotermes formosanus]
MKRIVCACFRSRGCADATGISSHPECSPTRMTSGFKSCIQRALTTGRCKSNMFKKEIMAHMNA